jgi:hypothetical protein
VKTIKKTKNGKKNSNPYVLIVAVLLFAIVINAAVYAFSHIEGPSTYGDDANYLWLANSVDNGSFLINPGYIFSVRLMQFMPIALFYKIFGFTLVGATFWDIMAYIGGILVTFMIGKFIYGYKEALLGAFLFSIFPVVTKFAVNTGEDVPLTFVSGLTILMFLYGERFQGLKGRIPYLVSGILLVVAWLIGYEAGIIIAFVLLYGFIELFRRKIIIDGKALFFVYGIILAFVVTFVFSYLNSHLAFATITVNNRFYSAIGSKVNNLPTIPTANQNLDFYLEGMFPYGIVNILLHGGGLGNAVHTVYNEVLTLPANDSDFGVYFYLFVIFAIVLLLYRDRSSYFFLAWFGVAFALLEFGPMHVGLGLNPIHVTYILAHRLRRFLMILAIPLVLVVSRGMFALIKPKNRYFRFVGFAVFLTLIVFIYLTSSLLTNFWYYLQEQQNGSTLAAGTYIRSLGSNVTVYVEDMQGPIITAQGSDFPAFAGRPQSQNIVNVNSTELCSAYNPGSYVVWNGTKECSNWINVYNISVTNLNQKTINEIGWYQIPYSPTNVYRVG